jgi:hypothetical protein
MLKTVAIIAMIIDHFGYYFSFCLEPLEYTIFRIIGRIAMPIFVFLLIQGYLNTSNLKKYSFKILFFALITQISLAGMYLINVICLPEHIVNVSKNINILFSLYLTLILIFTIDKKNQIINIESSNMSLKILNIIIRIVTLFGVFAIYYFIDIDYGFIVPVMGLGIYLFEMFRSYFKNQKNINIKEYENIFSYYNIIYYIGIFFVITICGIFEQMYGIYVGLSLIFIYSYNGKLGKKSQYLQRIYYLIFPLQHLILYIVSLILFIKI